MSKLLSAGLVVVLGLTLSAAPTAGGKAPGPRPQGQAAVKPAAAKKPAARPASRPAGRPASSASRPGRAVGGALRHGDHEGHERMSRTEWKLERIAQLEERGKSAAAQIAVFIADPCEEVSEEAYTVWSGMVEEMDPAWRARAIIHAAQAIQAGGHGAPAMPPPMAPAPQPVVVPQQPVVVPQQPVVVPQVQ